MNPEYDMLWKIRPTTTHPHANTRRPYSLRLWESRRPGLKTRGSVSENKLPAWTYCDHSDKQTIVFKRACSHKWIQINQLLWNWRGHLRTPGCQCSRPEWYSKQGPYYYRAQSTLSQTVSSAGKCVTCLSCARAHDRHIHERCLE